MKTKPTSLSEKLSMWMLLGMMTMLTISFLRMTLDDIRLWISSLSPSTVTAPVQYVYSEVVTRTNLYQTIDIVYLAGQSFGFTMPQVLSTAPKTDALRQAEQATFSFYDQPTPCYHSYFTSWIWDTRNKSLDKSSIYPRHEDSRSPEVPDECVPVFSLDLDGQEYLSLFSFRLQLLAAILLKIAIASFCPWMILALKQTLRPYFKF